MSYHHCFFRNILLSSIAAAIALTCVFATAVSAATLDVPGQYPNIQAAINAAQNGDVVRVAGGTYVGAGNVNLDFIGKAITLLGQRGASRTIIDCQGKSDSDDCRALHFHSNEAGAIIKGFTFTHGKAEQISNGGAVYVESGSAKFTDCIFDANAALRGGGIFVGEHAKATLIKCSFTRNLAEDSPRLKQRSGAEGGGGCIEGNASFTDCTFSGNGMVVPEGNGISATVSCSGSGLATNYGRVFLTGCTFTDNIGLVAGGLSCNSYLVMTGCRFFGNTATETGFESGGGAVRSSGEMRVVDCAFYDNTAPQGGGLTLTGGTPTTFINCVVARNTVTGSGASPAEGSAIYVDGDGHLAFINCTITGNSGPNNSANKTAAVQLSSDVTNFTNCILYGDVGSEIALGRYNQSPAMSHCDVEGTFAGDRNLEVDPKFLDGGAGNYGLKRDSPCLARGLHAGKALSNVVGSTGPAPLITPTTAAPATDFDGHSRPNPPSIGAYELGSAAKPLTVSH